jgi:hypothetical protein
VHPLWDSEIAGSAGPLGAGFDVVLVAHIACVLLGLGTVVVSGVVATRLLRRPEAPTEQVVRYYTPGVNWAGRVLYGVPVLGFVLLGLSQGSYGLDDGWVMEGLAIWVVIALAAEGLLWPAERRIQFLLATRSTSPGSTEQRVGLPSARLGNAGNGPPMTTAGERSEPGLVDKQIRVACQTIVWLSPVLVVAIVLATVLMVAQP